MSTSPLLEHDVTRSLHEVAQQLRVDSVRCSAAAASGHPTSSMSAADLMAVLLARHLRYDFSRAGDAGQRPPDLLQGPRVTAVLLDAAAAGAIGENEFLTYRRARSRLEGHPTPRLPWVDVATGSLGQGLPVGVGVAITGKSLDQLPYRVWVLCGDSELAEGSIWEAAEQAGESRLDNLTVIVDVNRLGQRGPTRHGGDTDRVRGQVPRVRLAHPGDRRARHRGDRPRVQRRGGPPRRALGDPGQDQEGPRGRGGRGHGGRARQAAARRRGGDQRARRPARHPGPGRAAAPVRPRRPVRRATAVPRRDRPACRRGAADSGRPGPPSARHWRRSVTSGRTSSCSTARWATPPAPPPSREAHPERFFECYVAEQQMLATAVGMQVRGWVPFAATFAAFFTRAYDFIRMAAVSRASIRLVGSDSGACGRRGRPVPDGPGGPGGAARRARQHRALPVRRQPGRLADAACWRTCAASATCAPAAATRR